MIHLEEKLEDVKTQLSFESHFRRETLKELPLPHPRTTLVGSFLS